MAHMRVILDVTRLEEVSSAKMAGVVLATAGYDHTIRFWEAASGTCNRTVKYPDSVRPCGRRGRSPGSSLSSVAAV
jgi:hypothetical protein